VAIMVLAKAPTNVSNSRDVLVLEAHGHSGDTIRLLQMGCESVKSFFAIILATLQGGAFSPGMCKGPCYEELRLDITLLPRVAYK